MAAPQPVEVRHQRHHSDAEQQITVPVGARVAFEGQLQGESRDEVGKDRRKGGGGLRGKKEEGYRGGGGGKLG
jgi:hypothetical protein